jgi:AcrR family transcriptional regulator
LTDALEQTQRSYHHGALRETLLASAREIVESEGVDAFTLREGARRAGVSHGAPAHHFGDKTGLLTELAIQSIEARMTLVDSYCATAAPDPLSQLKACGMANIDYLIAHPRLDELCWRSNNVDRSNERLQTLMHRMSGMLISRMSAVTGRTLNPDKESNPSTLLAMAVVHGFAQLVNEGVILQGVPEEERAARAHAMAEEMLDYMQGMFR